MPRNIDRLPVRRTSGEGQGKRTLQKMTLSTFCESTLSLLFTGCLNLFFKCLLPQATCLVHILLRLHAAGENVSAFSGTFEDAV